MKKLSKIDNPKSIAWNIIGSDFWKLGAENIKPNKKAIEIYLSCIKPKDACCIIGASSFDLIRQAINLNLDVTVIDFSERMCTDLEKALGRSDNIQIVLHDILCPPPSQFKNYFDFIITDRLINRFDTFETNNFLNSIANYLSKEGELRTIIRIGQYAIDTKLKDYQRQNNYVTSTIYDKTSDTIDFASARDIIEKITLTNGTISLDVLRGWYAHRGKETRYSEQSIENIFSLELTNKKNYLIREKIELTGDIKSMYYKLCLRDGI